MKDAWESGDPYEYFMGRWSRRVGESFVNWLAAASAKKWLDIGCGTGALSESVLTALSPAELVAIDQSEGFVNATRQRLGSAAHCEVGNAMALSFPDGRFDYVISGLMLNFVPDPVKALREMQRVTAPGGTVALYIWDYPGKMEFLNHFWDAVVALDPAAADLHEGTRFPTSTQAGVQQWFAGAGFENAVVEPLEIQTHFKDFDDYWQPFLGGQGPAGTYVQSLNEADRKKLRDYLHDHLPIDADGSITLTARAWAAKAGV